MPKYIPVSTASMPSADLKKLEVLTVPMDGLLIHCRVLWSISSAFPDSSPTGTYLYSWVEGGSARVHPFTPNIYTSTLYIVGYTFPDHVYYRWTRSTYRATVDRYIGRLSVNYRSTIDRLSVDSRPIVDR